MGSDEDKAEKKRLKAEYKLEKKRLKMEEEKQKEASQPKEELQAPPPQQPNEPSTIIVNVPKERWFEDPRWIGAIIGAISLTITLIIYFYG